MNNFQELIKEICNEQGIHVSVLSKDWVLMLEKDNKTRFISGYKFDLNPHGFGSIVDDKYATFEVLKKKNVPIIEHQILFSKNNKNDYAVGFNTYSKVEEIFEKYPQGIVLKANDSTCGNEVYHIKKKEDISFYLNQLFPKNFSISICPFYDIEREYRLIVLNNECQLLYGKMRPIVVGDGKKSIKELLVEFNPYYFKDKPLGEEYSRILKQGEIFEYHWQFNLSKGSIPFQVEDMGKKEKLLSIFKKITDTIDIGFCSIDIIETKEHEFYVIELNSGVMMKNYMEIMLHGKEEAKRIYSAAIRKMFEH